MHHKKKLNKTNRTQKLKTLKQFMAEGAQYQKQMDPPAVLIMKRKSIRQFPDDQRVALYYVDKIDKYVTVPYTAMQWSSTGPTTSTATKA